MDRTGEPFFLRMMRARFEPQTPLWAPDPIDGQSGDFIAVVIREICGSSIAAIIRHIR